MGRTACAGRYILLLPVPWQGILETDLLRIVRNDPLSDGLNGLYAAALDEHRSRGHKRPRRHYVKHAEEGRSGDAWEGTFNF